MIFAALSIGSETKMENIFFFRAEAWRPPLSAQVTRNLGGHAWGRRLYSKATELLITADSGGSNGYRLRLWKLELKKMADEIGLPISVCHFPPGTSKWNKVEHRLFSFISSNWRGEPLRDYETIVQLIAKTSTVKGLAVVCRLDRRKYHVGRKVSDAEMATINLVPDKFHGEWNYAIRPREYV